MTTENHSAHGHDGHGNRPAHLAHHFDTPRQQFESAKLGMWLFLATEILFFSGLFCAYSVYRANHPEVFIYASRYLDVFWGGLNTIILICSSLTMAWGVRNAQLGQRRLLALNLALTILFACGFLCIKYVEYSHKWHEGLLWGKYYNPAEHGEPDAAHADAAADAGDSDHAAETAVPPAPATDAVAGAGAAAGMPADFEPSAIRPAARVAGGLAQFAEQAAPVETRPAPATESELRSPLARIAAFFTPVHHGDEPASKVQLFFSIYFFMTGLHGLHVLIGIGLIGWLLVRSLRGHFSPGYFTPVDLVGLYWHLVDMIWIYLFPLLYLIH